MNDGEWGTEIEIFAFASMFATNIFVFGPYGSGFKWMKHLSKSPPLGNLAQSKKAVYILSLALLNVFLATEN